MEEQVSFASDNIHLDGLFEQHTGSKAVIITHPHSLYGGDMNNAVVSVIQQVYSKTGYSTLRFNFRGVGRSDGSFDNGIGDNDDFGELETLKKRLSIMNPEAPLEIISDTDHFYTGSLDQLSAIIEAGLYIA